MRLLGSALQSAISTGSTTLCRIFTITSQSGEVRRFTDLDIDLTYDGNTYQASKSFKVTNITMAANSGVSTTNVEIMLGADSITELEMLQGFWDSGTFKVSWIDWSYPDNGEIVLLVGDISTSQLSNKYMGAFEVRGILNRADQRIGQYYQAECSADLGDARCTKPLDTFTVAGIITGVTSRTRLSANFSSISGFYSFGVLTWTSGANTGLSIEVLSQVATGGLGQSLITALEMPADPEIGDEFNIVAGCDKRSVTCKDKFDNILNFRGYPFVPGNSIIADRLIE